MEDNKRANQLIRNILNDLDHTGIIFNTLSANLKKLREYAVADTLPVVAKALRLAYEHLDEYETFVAPIPTEDEYDEENPPEKITGTESMIYFINLIKKPENPVNKQEIRSYIAFLEDFSI
ncbi:MAG: hypothetical protein LAT51_06535 [Flavobacteriaceae bacterium]|nr:hypothetical protein [Flavobacteriaceae bacterium]